MVGVFFSHDLYISQFHRKQIFYIFINTNYDYYDEKTIVKKYGLDLN